ncbi:MAG TPA: BamA/TamA family outer membrane protein, partial [Balneolaceae bacterium]|nr:BamA/TamA family outer membrane protein [Balneolaceae bacterium]
DGSRMAVNTINEGLLDVYMIRSPERLKKDAPLEPNEWARIRDRTTQAERVPATGYVRQMLRTNPIGETSLTSTVAAMVDTTLKKAIVDTLVASVPKDSLNLLQEDTADTIDFRNYTFETSLTEDSAFVQEYLDEAKFELDNNKTDDGRYVPKDYRLKFSTDIVYAGGNFSTYYGANGVAQIIFSDLLGNHQVAFGSNLNFDLRNSNYFLQYVYLEHRTNWSVNFFHNAVSFQDFSGQLYRFRSYGGSINMQYPFDKFRRIDVGLSVVSLEQSYTRAFTDIAQNRSSTFFYPQITYTTDKALYGFITPVGGSRYSVSLTASPPIGDLQFVSVLGDYRKYFNLGRGYSFAVRGSGAVSLGGDSQTFFMGGMLGWINQRWSNRSLPLDKLGDTFFTLPALPLRGHPYNATSGDRFTLLNLEFRFPLFAAVLPGPIPFLPLYNITGVAFIDAGMAWGQEIPYEVTFTNGDVLTYGTNPAGLNFEIQKQADKYYDSAPGIPEGERIKTSRPANIDQQPDRYTRLPFSRGDILMGAGFGLRTIVFGLPLRYDIGWPYYRDGFGGDPIHYITIGIDF